MKTINCNLNIVGNQLRKIGSSVSQRSDALDAIMSNEQFTKPKFWKLVDDDLRKAVVKAIEKARQLEKASKISRLETELVGVSRHVPGKPVGKVLAGSGKPEHDIFGINVEHIGARGKDDSAACRLALVPGVHADQRSVNVVEEQRDQVGGRHDDHVPVLRVSDLMDRAGQEPAGSCECANYEYVQRSLHDS